MLQGVETRAQRPRARARDARRVVAAAYGVALEFLEDDHHVKVLQAEDDALEVHDLDVRDLHDHPRRLDELDERVDGRHDERRRLVDEAVEAQLAVRDVELEVARLRARSEPGGGGG
jgi:rRNA processing protein Krr1/Pno1